MLPTNSRRFGTENRCFTYTFRNPIVLADFQRLDGAGVVQKINIARTQKTGSQSWSPVSLYSYSVPALKAYPLPCIQFQNNKAIFKAKSPCTIPLNSVKYTYETAEALKGRA